MFTDTRPMLTPQAKPKELRFKFDQEAQKDQEEEKSKNNSAKKKKTKSRSKHKGIFSCYSLSLERVNLAIDEENVDDEAEETSVFLLNTCLVKKPLYYRPTMNRGVQVKLENCMIYFRI